ncbi:MAG: septum formation initiator family protein [Pseudomonadota bacterium]
MARHLRKTVRSRKSNFIVPLVAVMVTGYFAYHVFHGEHGIAAWQTLERQSVAKADQLAELQATRGRLESRVDLLRPDSVDPDLLDERVRRTLNFAGPNDIIVIPQAPN